MTPSRTSARARTRRADARRNRDAIVAAARDAFAADGSATSMAEIARRAGVGMATLYRNFPNRRALLEALYRDNVEELARSAEGLAERPPWEALSSWLRAFADYFGTKQTIAAELLEEETCDGRDPVFSDSRRALFAAAGPLLERAQAAGEARADATLDEVMELVVGIAKISTDQPGRVDRILTIALDGLRAR